MKDSEAVYMTGNGRIAAAYRRGDIVQLFGPPYSSPSLFESRWIDEPERSLPERLPHSLAWRVRLKDGAEVTDFALPDQDAVVRRVESRRPVRMLLSAKPELFSYEVPERKDSDCAVLLLKTRNGNPLYNDYPLPFPQFFKLIVRGAQVAETEPYRWEITFRGASELIFAGGPSYPECDVLACALLSRPYPEMLRGALEKWEKPLARLDSPEFLPEGVPQRDALLRVLEGTAAAILAQQSAEGGVLAGYNYHMGYVRDQFGVCMGLLKLGFREQARAILRYYAGVFRRSGKILNAQAMGVPDLFHFAENDASEITGYLLLQFFRYADAAGDTEILAENEDFLRWLYLRQESQLAGGMMPFNGDETYIAGGLLPRSVICDGSAEATMLFVLSGERLLDFYEKRGLRTAEERARMRGVLAETRAAYAANFVRGGRYTLNAPERRSAAPQPEYRYGVCMNLGQGGCEFFGWTKRCADGVYLCPKCVQAGRIPAPARERYKLPSALLLPLYLGSDLPDRAVSSRCLAETASVFEAEGHFYSDRAHEKNVGYDYGLLLYGLTAARDGRAGQAAARLLEQTDETGVWSEYYVRGEPCGTRYRPWESAVNADALLTWAQSGLWKSAQNSR